MRAVLIRDVIFFATQNHDPQMGEKQPEMDHNTEM